jgi:hypothetical protein
MTRALVDRIADAVLYEGYILYPYRRSVKNRQRWTFGGLYPEAYCRANKGSDAPYNQTECLVEGSRRARLQFAVRFLHLTDRIVGRLETPLLEWSDELDPPYLAVDELRVGDERIQSWQEAEERRIALPPTPIEALIDGEQPLPFSLSGRRWREPLRAPDGAVVGLVLREQQPLEALIETTATEVSDSLFRVTLRVVNRTALPTGGKVTRDDVMLRTLVSTHAILRVEEGHFVSLLDPPAHCVEAAAGCRNVGVWPILVGEPGDHGIMLSSPIILYDYPQIAPESPGDLFDGTEIDEILTLRVLTLTDEEKQAGAALDPRARQLLARTETLARDQLLGLHGTMRTIDPRQVP